MGSVSGILFVFASPVRVVRVRSPCSAALLVSYRSFEAHNERPLPVPSFIPSFSRVSRNRVLKSLRFSLRFLALLISLQTKALMLAFALLFAALVSLARAETFEFAHNTDW